MGKNVKDTGGVTFAGLLTILFVGLKLSKVIDWPWLWVLAPVWIGLMIVMILFVSVFAIIFVQEVTGNSD